MASEMSATTEEIQREDKTQVKRWHKQPDGNEISNGPLTTWDSLSTVYF